jgi:hypothetical protein
MYNHNKHNYVKKFEDWAKQFDMKPSQIYHVNIYHDDWCATHDGGYCNCDPEFELKVDGNSGKRHVT